MSGEQQGSYHICVNLHISTFFTTSPPVEFPELFFSLPKDTWNILPVKFVYVFPLILPLTQRAFITANAERKIKTKGFIPDVFEICKKYEMFEYIDIYLKGGRFLEKRQWAKICKHNVKSAEREVWLQNMQIKDDCPLASLSIIGPHPHILYKIAKSDITIQHSCTESIKLLAIPLSTNNPVCSRRGSIMVYKLKFKFFIGITKHDKGFTNHKTKKNRKGKEKEHTQ